MTIRTPSSSRLGLNSSDFISCDSGGICVFDQAIVEVYAVDIGDGGEPGEDIGELFLQISPFCVGRRLGWAVIVRQCGRELPKLLGEVEECPGGASGVVGCEIAIADELLKCSYGEVVWVVGGHGRIVG
jgi:hypothetical protein